MKDMTVSKAMRWMFIAQLLTLLVIIPLVGWILSIVGIVMEILALYGAGKLEQGYQKAFYLSIAALVWGVILGFFRDGGFVYTLFSAVGSLIGLGILYYVCSTTCGLLRRSGADAVAKTGDTVWKINLLCTVVGVVLTLIAAIPVIGILASIASVVVAIVQIVGGILYIIFLYKSAAVL